MIYNLVLVGLGGAAGSMLRYLCGRALNAAAFPYGTFLVNILGCLLIGLLWGMFTRHLNEHWRLLLVTGFCGGFTTFSTFSYEGVQMLQDNRWLTFALYAALSLGTGLIATYFGYKLTN